MCFSAEADLVAGAVITGIGVDTLRHVRQPSERALAALPAVLGVHLLIEAVVWRGLEGHGPTGLWRAAMIAYLFVAFGMLPVLVPLAVGALESSAHRARVRSLTVLGAAVAAVLMYALARGPVDASIDGLHIAYQLDVWHGGPLVALYVLATCGSLLLSEHAHVRLFGTLNLVAVLGLAWLDQRALISIWCAWAAVTSAAVAIHLRRSPRRAGVARASPGGDRRSATEVP